MTLTLVTLGSSAFLGSGPVTFRPRLTAGLALSLSSNEVDHKGRFGATQHFPQDFASGNGLQRGPNVTGKENVAEMSGMHFAARNLEHYAARFGNDRSLGRKSHSVTPGYGQMRLFDRG